jgi:ABC-type arginine transport system ATPase subunit
MAHFSIAHVLRLRDGMFAVRSAEYPSCEGHDFQMWPAREQFRQALSERVRHMIQQGELPPLCASLAEAQSSLAEHCKIQLPAADRLPKTYDYAVIVPLDLSPDDAERFAAARAGKLIPEPQLFSEPQL